MGRKSAHTGESPKDRSINIMDKFISKNMNREKHQPFKSARQKDPNNPVYMWPLKDQIEYWENRTASDWFDDKYPIYSFWIADVQSLSKVHSSFFTDKAIKLKDLLQQMYDEKTMPKDAVAILRKHGVY
jgi:hypothetical protein